MRCFPCGESQIAPVGIGVIVAAGGVGFDHVGQLYHRVRVCGHRAGGFLINGRVHEKLKQGGAVGLLAA